MALSYYPAAQHTGRRAQWDALTFRLLWRLISIVVVPMLSLVARVLIKLLEVRTRRVPAQ